MSLPANFSEVPKEELHRHFRNFCIAFEKVLKSSKKIDDVAFEVERFIDLSKQMNWHQKNGDVFRKDEGDKAANKVIAESQRYLKSLQTKDPTATPQDLLDALKEVERLILSLKAC